MSVVNPVPAHTPVALTEVCGRRAARRDGRDVVWCEIQCGEPSGRADKFGEPRQDVAAAAAWVNHVTARLNACSTYFALLPGAVGLKMAIEPLRGCLRRAG